MESTNQPDQDKSSKSKLYFIIAIVLLFVLALTWSVDGSFFYLISGPIGFFFYLGFRNLPSKQKDTRYQDQERPRYSDTSTTTTSSFGDAFESFFKKKQTEFTSNDPTSPPSKFGKRFFVGCISVTMFFLFFISFIVSLFGSEELNYYDVAEQYYNSQEFDSAYVNYERASKEDEADDKPFIGMGNVAFELNRLDSALVSYDQALQINSNSSEIQFKRGLILYYQKKYDQAAQTLAGLFEKDPTYFDALQKLGDVYYDQKRYDEALKYYDQAYANGVRNNWICYVSGYLYEEKGNTQKAISLYKEALSYDSTVVDIYSRLGTLLPGTDGDFLGEKQTKAASSNHVSSTS